MINWNKIFNRKLECAPLSITLGEKLPWPEYSNPGEFSAVILNEQSFDVVISLINLSRKEIKAISQNEFQVFIIKTDYCPFLVFKFGNVFKCDLTINLRKMNPDNIEYWFQSNESTVNIYLLEGRTAKVKAIRIVPFTEMVSLKQSCLFSFNHTKEDIEAFIQTVYSRYSIEQLMSNSAVQFTVNKTYNLL